MHPLPPPRPPPPPPPNASACTRSQVFAEFAGRKPAGAGIEGDTFTGTGDVKYHLGTSFDRPTASGAACKSADSHG